MSTDAGVRPTIAQSKAATRPPGSSAKFAAFTSP